MWGNRVKQWAQEKKQIRIRDCSRSSWVAAWIADRYGTYGNMIEKLSNDWVIGCVPDTEPRYMRGCQHSNNAQADFVLTGLPS
jgi:hypothetical protein